LRKISFEVTTDTSHFSPLQLQPRMLLSTSFNAMSQWLRAHLVSFPKLIHDHRFSVVILAAEIEFAEPLTFWDTDALKVEATFQVRRERSRAQLDVTYRSERGPAAKVGILLCPVKIDDPVSLAAEPCEFEGELLARFQPEEVIPSSPDRPLPRLLESITAGAKPLATYSHPFTVYRHLCEVADQWAFLEVPTLVSASRESLARIDGAKHPVLRNGVSRPMRHYYNEFTRPYFWMQEGRVDTIAYPYKDGVAYVHRLFSMQPREETHGTIIELF
jgi:hypothetical protein